MTHVLAAKMEVNFHEPADLHLQRLIVAQRPHIELLHGEPCLRVESRAGEHPDLTGSGNGTRKKDCWQEKRDSHLRWSLVVSKFARFEQLTDQTCRVGLAFFPRPNITRGNVTLRHEQMLAARSRSGASNGVRRISE